MNKVRHFILLVSTFALSYGLWAQTPVEIALVDNLDEPRGHARLLL